MLFFYQFEMTITSYTIFGTRFIKERSRIVTRLIKDTRFTLFSKRRAIFDNLDFLSVDFKYFTDYNLICLNYSSVYSLSSADFFNVLRIPSNTGIRML